MEDSEGLDSLKEKMSSSLPSESPLRHRLPPSTLQQSLGSPLLTRSRKMTSPGSTNFSLVSATDHISSLRDGGGGPGSLIASRPLSVSNSSIDTTCSLDTPQATPTLTRRNMGSSISDLTGLSRSSSTLSLTSGCRLSPMDSILKHLRDRLLGALFSGWYTERRYVEAVDRYRDVVLVDPVESKVIRQVKYALRKSGKILAENSFIGLSFQEDECRLYLNFGPGGTSGEASHAFGHYWFQIRGISFLQGFGFCLEVAVIRPYVASDSENCWKCKQRAAQDEPEAPVKIDSVGAALADMKARLTAMSRDLLMEAWDPTSWTNSLRSLLTPANFVAFLKFLLVLLLAAVTGLLSGCKQLAGWSLTAIHELAFLVDRSTPFALGALNMVSKLVGGFYLLVAMIWKDVRKPRPPTSQPLQPSAPLALQNSPSPYSQPRAALPQPQNDARQRPPSSLSAMDNMYSQGRTW